jgi:hypothetical protein
MLASRRVPWRAAFAVAACTFVLVLPPSLNASVTVPATLDELAVEADLVVHARVARVETRQAPGTLRVERVVVLETLRPLKGSPSDGLYVVLPGGTFGRYRTVVPGMPDVVEGEEAVFFLRAPATAAPQLVGFSQGLLRVRVDPVTGARTVGGAVLAGRDGPVVRGATDRGPQPLSVIEDRIASVVLAQVRGRR